MTRANAMTVLCIVSTAVSAASAHQPSEGPVLSATSSDQHAWIIVPAADAPDKFALMHYTPHSDGEHASTFFTISPPPVAMAAWGNRVWLVEEADSGFRRRVLTTRTIRDPTTGLDAPDPPHRLELATPLEGAGVLAGIAGTANGPVALLAPPQHAEVEVRRTPPVPEQPVLRQPRLVRLEGLEWVELPLPEYVRVTHESRLMAGGSPRDSLVILTKSPHDPDVTDVFTEVRADQWRHEEVQLNLRNVRALTSAGTHRLVAYLDSPADDTAESIRLGYLRAEGITPLGSIDAPTQPWTVLGFDDGVRFIVAMGSERLSMRHMGLLGGPLTDAVELSRPTGNRFLWYGALLFALAVGAVFFSLVARPSDRTPSLPEGTVVLGLLPRCLALVIDLAPATALAMFLTGASLQEFLRLPIANIRPDDALAYVIAAAVAVLHGCIGELLCRASLGKWLMGGQVVAADGSRPGPLRVVMRNGVKLMILLIPPLAVIMLLSPFLQGLNDLVARTVVVRIEAADAEDEPRD